MKSVLPPTDKKMAFSHHHHHHHQFPSKKTLQSPLLILLASLACGSLSDNPYSNCSENGDYAINSTFHRNLLSLLSSMSSNASTGLKFHSATSGDSTTGHVYAQHMCLNYALNETCGNCISGASQDIIRLCPNDTEAVVWEEMCQLRYSDRDFFGSLDVTGNQCYSNKMNVSKPEKFRDIVNETLQNLTRVAASSPDMFSTGNVDLKDSRSLRTLFALVQCGRDLSAENCIICLRAAIEDVLANASSSFGARLLSRSCYLRYELYAFYEGAKEPIYDDQTVSPSSNESSTHNGKKALLTLILTVALVAVTLVVVGSLVYYLRTHRRDNQAYDPDNPFISLRTILSATNNFSTSNLLGEGGFGPVYKGVLCDGREVAVKLLSSTEQGVDEFTNEVLLLMSLQHRNLVKLLGFCVEQEERMLVYEFMPNSSLDVVLFDPERRADHLNWSRRLNIIEGIARGVLYLHDGSRHRIIHRDLKPSNILLDSDMNAKISDFGTARICAGNDAGDSTATIVGTYGYMPQEYAMDGIYSIKSDVFSFGVILLEIITGERNAGFRQSNRALTLLAYVWQLWSEGRGLELVEPMLKDSTWDPQEFNKYLHIGLLCVQVDPEDRPTMSAVSRMLMSESTALRQPERPALSAGRLEARQQENNRNSSCSVSGVSISDVIPR